jgi:hypothetical protein
MPSVTARTTSRIASRSKRRDFSASSVTSCTRWRMSSPLLTDSLAAWLIFSLIVPPL